MEYSFDKNELKSKLKESKRLYKNGIITQNEYNILMRQIKMLLGHVKKEKSSFPSLKEKLTKINNMLVYYDQMLTDDSVTTLETLVDNVLDDEIPKPKEISYPVGNEELLKLVLDLYKEVSSDDSDFLSELANNGKLEISLPKYSFDMTSITQLLYYNDFYIRIVRSNTVYDACSIAHEFRHILDRKNTTKIEGNVLSEINPIFMELYFNSKLYKENNTFGEAIIDRLYDNYKIASNINSFLALLNCRYNIASATDDIIYECFNCSNELDLLDIIDDLSSGLFSLNFDYFIGTIGAINIYYKALDNIYDALKIVNKIAYNISSPIELDDVLKYLGSDSVEQYHNFVNTYVKKK